MTVCHLRRSATRLRSLVLNTQFLSSVTSYCSSASDKFIQDNERPATSTRCHSEKINLSPLLSDKGPHFGGYNIEVVDDDTWQVSAGLAHVWRGLEEETEAKADVNVSNDDDNAAAFEDGDSDFDVIDNMRIRGDLFYKLDKDSKEYEEYSFDFHRRKKTKEEKREGEKKEASKAKSDLKECQQRDASKRNSELKQSETESPGQNVACRNEELDKFVIGDILSNMEKRVRTPTFNQLTAPFHEPFCLDIFISKASVRGCIIHRVTSKVVAVAHSISKDMKFDLNSSRDATACAAVGGILAQRALADDIHDVVYTPRKGEKLEGKLLIVLQAVVDNGINVKVKLKQRKHKKGSHRPPA